MKYILIKGHTHFRFVGDNVLECTHGGWKADIYIADDDTLSLFYLGKWHDYSSDEWDWTLEKEVL